MRHAICICSLSDYNIIFVFLKCYFMWNKVILKLVIQLVCTIIICLVMCSYLRSSEVQRYCVHVHVLGIHMYMLVKLRIEVVNMLCHILICARIFLVIQFLFWLWNETPILFLLIITGFECYYYNMYVVGCRFHFHCFFG